MSNHLRIVYNNAADRSSISASTTAGSLVAANMLNDRKGDVYRSTGTSSTITMTFSSGEFMGVVATPFCNFTSSATIRVRAYVEIADAVPIVDTGDVLACAPSPLGSWEWGLVPLGTNSYSYGGEVYGRVWFDIVVVKKLVIDIVDTYNPDGYLEIGRIVAGAYFIPNNNAELDAKFDIIDTTKNERSEAGDLISDVGNKSKKIGFNLQHMTPSDRISITNILKGNGLTKPIFVSLYPDDVDAAQEQLYQVYGKLPQMFSVGISYWNAFNSSIEVEEV